MKFDETTGEMTLVSLHPGVTVEKVQENTPWKLKVSDKLQQTPTPTEKEIMTLRSLDPKRMYLG
jgi:glutaconate CoA-transferase subunit B